MNIFSIALRFFWRDWRSGELRLPILALMIAIGGITSINVLIDRIEQGMQQQARQILGADSVITSPRPINSTLLERAVQLNLAHASSLEFSTMAVANDTFELSNVHAVDSHYPLAGTLTIARKNGERTVSGAPPANHVWVSERLLRALDLTIGDTIELGVHHFRIDATLINQPGSSAIIDFAPKLIMPLSDVAKTQIIQPGSRVLYRYDFAGESALLDEFTRWAESQLEPGQEILTVETSSSILRDALAELRGYLSLAAILGLLLGGVAIAISIQHYSQRHFDYSALMRCLGCSQRDILSIYSLVLFITALLGSILGIILGYAAQQGLVLLLGSLLPQNIPNPSLQPAYLALFSGLIIVAGFSIPSLMRLGEVSPMRIFRQDLPPMPNSGWLLLTTCVLAIGIILYWQTGNLLLVTLLLLSGTALTAVLLLFARLALQSVRQLMRNATFSIRFAIEQLLRFRNSASVQIIAFSSIITLMCVLSIIRNELISDWQQQLPATAPNHFLVNLAPEDTDAFIQFAQNNALKISRLYPMVRGRLTRINGRNPEELLGQNWQERHDSLRRELNLTWAKQQPDNNPLIAGQWDMHNNQDAVLSIETDMAQALQLELGDRLTFNIGGLTTNATITSIRQVNWSNMQPNFYIIFSPNVLDDFAATFITSFYLPIEKKSVLNDLLEQFPTVSVIELDRVMRQVNQILSQASLAINFVLVFVLITGLIVLLATLQTTLDDKKYTAGLLRAFGASTGLIRQTTFTEYAILSLIAGLLAAISTESIVYGLYTWVFDIQAKLHPELWLIAPLLAVVFIIPAGLWGMRKIQRTAPLVVLRQS